MRTLSHNILLLVIAAGSLLLPAQSSWAQTAQSIIECDRLAASPLDPTKPLEIPGVAFDAVDSEKAIVACEAAVIAQPNNSRIQYQYGRALDAGNRKKSALEVYKKAFELGSNLAAHNVGAIFYAGAPGVEKDKKAALSWYEIAAKGGFDLSKRMSAIILDDGEGLPSPNPERASLYWRSLANSGDPEAAEKVGLAINDKRIAPLTTNELTERLKMAADKGRVIAAYQYAQLLKKRGNDPDDITQGAKYALLAYHLAVAAPLDSEGGWPVYQWSAFGTYEHFIQAGAQNTMPIAEYDQARADYATGGAKRFTVPVDCEGTKAPFEVYIWQWTRNYPQTDLQAEWLKQARGCTISKDIVDSFRKLFSIAIENKVSFPDLAVYALDNRNHSSDQKKSGTAAQMAAKQESTQPPPDDKGLSTGEAVAIGATVASSLACWYWPEQCKELAWEVVKQGARELVKGKQ